MSTLTTQTVSYQQLKKLFPNRAVYVRNLDARYYVTKKSIADTIGNIGKKNALFTVAFNDRHICIEKTYQQNKQ
jgi:hypothetical protein